MGMGNLLFLRPCGAHELEANMREAKKRFPQLQILFVIINRKGDPAYGNNKHPLLFIKWHYCIN